MNLFYALFIVELSGALRVLLIGFMTFLDLEDRDKVKIYFFLVHIWVKCVIS